MTNSKWFFTDDQNRPIARFRFKTFRFYWRRFFAITSLMASVDIRLGEMVFHRSNNLNLLNQDFKCGWYDFVSCSCVRLLKKGVIYTCLYCSEFFAIQLGFFNPAQQHCGLNSPLLAVLYWRLHEAGTRDWYSSIRKISPGKIEPVTYFVVLLQKRINTPLIIQDNFPTAEYSRSTIQISMHL